MKGAREPAYPYYHLLKPELGTEVPMLMSALLHQHLQLSVKEETVRRTEIHFVDQQGTHAAKLGWAA